MEQSKEKSEEKPEEPIEEPKETNEHEPEQLKQMNDQLKILLEEVSAVKKELKEKEDLSVKIKELTEEIASLKMNMISKNDLKIDFKTLSGKTFSQYVKKSDKIKDLKQRIQEKENTPIEELNLFLDKQLLNDNSTVAESNIKETSNLYLIKAKEDFLNFASYNEKIFIINALKDNVFRKIKNCLYSARRHGDDANNFHKHCDNQGELLYVIKAKNNVVFAIYVSKPLFSDNNTRTDSLQMVISPSHNFAVKSLNDHATYHNNPNSGATFHCMQLNTPFLSSNCVDIQSCSDFNLPCYPTGNSSYQIKELEVFSLEKSD